MVLAVLNFILKIPAMISFFEKLMAEYTKLQVSKMKKENRDAIRKAIEEHDQRDAEKAIGNPDAGEASGEDGAVIVDAPPPNVGV